MLRIQRAAELKFHVILTDGRPGIVSGGNDFAEVSERVIGWNAKHGYRRYTIVRAPFLGE